MLIIYNGIGKVKKCTFSGLLYVLICTKTYDE
nr:MAG TPA: hypothetical protein [Inoviridae sp.]